MSISTNSLIKSLYFPTVNGSFVTSFIINLALLWVAASFSSIAAIWLYTLCPTKKSIGKILKAQYFYLNKISGYTTTELWLNKESRLYKVTPKDY